MFFTNMCFPSLKVSFYVLEVYACPQCLYASPTIQRCLHANWTAFIREIKALLKHLVGQSIISVYTCNLFFKPGDVNVLGLDGLFLKLLVSKLVNFLDYITVVQIRMQRSFKNINKQWCHFEQFCIKEAVLSKCWFKDFVVSCALEEKLILQTVFGFWEPKVWKDY